MQDKLSGKMDYFHQLFNTTWTQQEKENEKLGFNVELQVCTSSIQVHLSTGNWLWNHYTPHNNTINSSKIKLAMKSYKTK
jgi:hypothetical protein